MDFLKKHLTFSSPSGELGQERTDSQDRAIPG